MSIRGRGTMEINPSNSPFFQTTSQTIGVNPYQVSAWETNRAKNFQLQRTEHMNGFSFQFSRESDRIGNFGNKKIPNNLIAPHNEMDSNNNRETQSQKSKVKQSPEEILAFYVHEAKKEHPLYITSANEYGKKAPNSATIVVERNNRQQEFSRSFGNIKPRNSSMNTSITRSTIHGSLDPQFL